MAKSANSRKESLKSQVKGDGNAAVQTVLENISNEAHVRVQVNDLVAFEYVDPKTEGWKWRLGTVAALPGPRLARVMLWSGGDDSVLPPTSSPISKEERAKAVQRLEELRAQKQQTTKEAVEINKDLTTKQAEYEAGRKEFTEVAAKAEETLHEARTMVQSVQEKDWREIRSYVKPPAVVQLVMEATMLTLGEKTPTWPEVLKVIRANDFVKRIAEFDPAKLNVANRRTLSKKYLKDPKFTYDNAMKGSRALGALQRWVTAQSQTASVTADLHDYDIKKKDDREAIKSMEGQLARAQKALEDFEAEENRLLECLGDKPVPVGGEAAAGAGDGAQQGRPAASPVVESIHGVNRTWHFTDEMQTILRSSILVNYDAPAAKVITLTPEQVDQLVKALKARAPRAEQDKQAEAQRKRLQDELNDARGDCADAKKKLQELLAAQNDLENDLAAKERELEALKEAAAAAQSSASGFPLSPDSSTSKPAQSAGSIAVDPVFIQQQQDEIDALKDRLKEAEKAAEEAQQALREAEAEAAAAAATPLATDKDRGDKINGSAPQLQPSASTVEKDWSGVLAVLEKETKALRVATGVTSDVTEDINRTIASNPRFKAVMSGA